MHFRPMQPTDTDAVLAMSRIFYNSSALSHPIPQDIIHSNLTVALSDDDILTGYILLDEVNGAEQTAGFAYLTQYYETEVGGVCVQIIDLYVDPAHRGRGLGSGFLRYVFEKFPHARRFRLEVTRDNRPALALYRHLGFTELTYGQMVIDRP